MSRRIRLDFASIVLASMLGGCATPTQLNFDVGEPTADTAALGGDSLLALEGAVTAEPTTTSPDQSAADGSLDTTAIEQRFASLITDWVSCFHRPSDCDVSVSTAPDSPEHVRLADALAYYSAEQLRTKPNEGRLEWRIESISASSDDRVRLTTCEYDTRIFFDSSMAQTELGDIILDATVWTRRVEWVLSRNDDTWRLWSRRVERRSPAERFCGV